MSTPWETAMDIPSAHGLAADTFAHLCGGPGAYVLSTPEYFLLARQMRFNPDDAVDPGYLSARTNPFMRWHPRECNAWCIGVLAGDMVAAYRALVAVGGEREFICWQDRHNGYRWRRTGPKFDAYLSSIQKARDGLRRIHPVKVGLPSLLEIIACRKVK